MLAFQIDELRNKIRVSMHPEDISRHLPVNGACHKRFTPKTQQGFGLSFVLAVGKNE